VNQNKDIVAIAWGPGNTDPVEQLTLLKKMFHAALVISLNFAASISFMANP
jgi:hypothetical protein